MSDKKMGRPPSQNPKSVKLTVRIDISEKEILDDYCKKTDTSTADGVREGIRRLKD